MKNFLSSYIDNPLKISTKKFSLIIGSNPSSGARSPKLWNKVYKKKKIDCRMYPADIKLKNLKKALELLKKNSNFIGGSVTIPYKEKVIKFLDEIDQTSKKINSVNTIVRKKNKLIGFNTDYFGFANSFSKFNIKKRDSILVLGAGGAGKAVISFIINNCPENKKYFFNRSNYKLVKFLKKFNRKKLIILKNFDDIKKITDVKLVINTTSIGFDTWFNNKKKYFNLKYFSPLGSLSKIKFTDKKNEKIFLKYNKNVVIKNIISNYNFFKNNPKSKVYDIIYSPKKTVIMKHATSFKNYNLNGLNMNLDQAVTAFLKVNNVKSFKTIKNIMNK